MCDRTSAVALLSEMLGMMGEGELGVKMEDGKEMEVSLGIEDYIPCGQGNKPFWARGVDMLGYSLNSFRLANLGFKDAVSPRMSRVVRLQMSADDTNRILSVSELFLDYYNFDGVIQYFLDYSLNWSIKSVVESAFS